MHEKSLTRSHNTVMYTQPLDYRCSLLHPKLSDGVDGIQAVCDLAPEECSICDNAHVHVLEQQLYLGIIVAKKQNFHRQHEIFELSAEHHRPCFYTGEMPYKDHHVTVMFR